MNAVVEKLGRRQLTAVRHAVNNGQVLARRPTASQRMLPSFLVIGGQRCGTTSMYQYLCEHPDVVGPLRKELHFFGESYPKGTLWYRSHFPRATNSRQQTFEATPYYLFHPAAPAQVRTVLPAARLLVLVRNPVERAFSHYQHSVSLGLEPLSFEDALEAEEARLATYSGAAHRRYSYFSRGCYADQLVEWFRQFPRRQMLIVFSEDFYRDTGAVFDQVLGFLELAPFKLTSFPHTRKPDRDGPPLSDKARSRLNERYAVPNQRLAELLGRDPGWND